MQSAIGYPGTDQKKMLHCKHMADFVMECSQILVLGSKPIALLLDKYQ